MFLLLGSDFGNEIELGSAFGSKDNVPHTDTNHENDWECLNKFLTCLNNSHGEVFISLKDKEQEKIPKDYQKDIMSWTEEGLKEEESKPKEQQERKQQEEIKDDGKDWINISYEFNASSEANRKKNQGITLKEQWLQAKFNYQSVKEWIDAGIPYWDVDFSKWLRDTKKLTPQQVLSYGNMEQLKKEYQDSNIYNLD